MPPTKFTPQLAAIFASLVEEACGLHYGPQDHEILGSKIEAQALEVGYESLLDYYYRLRYDDPTGVEKRALVYALLVHETYFFRELTPLEVLVDGHLTQVVRSKGHARLWSAACSTGEEPITLAMLLAERGLLDKVEIIATDLSENAIARARTGKHSRRAVRDGHPGSLARRHLDITATGVTSSARLREAIEFRTLNLIDDAAIEQLGPFDAIVCRNVLIYFGDAMITRVLDRLTRSLAPGGILTVGVSESLLRFGTSLICEERSGAFFYRRAR